MRQSGKTKGVILAITGAFMWGIMGIFVRELSAKGFSGFDISFLRCLLAGAAFFVFKAVTDREVLRVDPWGLVICFLYGISSYAVGFVCYNVSVERIPVAVATVLMFMSPVWVAILSVLIFRERLRMQTVIIILICVLGAAMVSDVFHSSGQKMDLIGIVCGIVNGLGVALQLLIPRFFAKRLKRDTMLVYGFLGAALGLAFLTDFSVIRENLFSADGAAVLRDLLCLGILCTMVANVSFVKSALYIHATTASILSALEVVVGAAVGLLVFHESMNLLQVVGAFVVVGGSLGPTLLVKKAEHEKQEIDVT